jgi:hypothetical protein
VNVTEADGNNGCDREVEGGDVQLVVLHVLEPSLVDPVVLRLRYEGRDKNPINPVVNKY